MFSKLWEIAKGKVVVTSRPDEFADDDAGVSLAESDGQIGEAERAAVDVLRHGLHSIDIDVGCRGYGGRSGETRQRKRDEIGSDGEIALDLYAAESNRPCPAKPLEMTSPAR